MIYSLQVIQAQWVQLHHLHMLQHLSSVSSLQVLYLSWRHPINHSHCQRYQSKKLRISVFEGLEKKSTTKILNLSILGCRKSSIKPPWGLFNFGHFTGRLTRKRGLLERGGLFTKSNEKDGHDSFSFLCTTFCGFSIRCYRSNT